MVALYMAHLLRSSPRDDLLTGDDTLLFTTSSLSLSVYDGVSALDDVTKTWNHVHKDDGVYLKVVITRDDCVQYQVSYPEVKVQFLRYYLQR